MNHLLRRAGLVLGMAALTLSPALHAQEEAPKANLESELARECYSAGAMIGKSILEPGLELDVEAMVAGFEAALKGGELAMEETDMRMAFKALQDKLRDAAQAKAMAMAESAKADGEAYLAENAKKEGVKVTESGLQYKVIKEGDGASPTAADQVSVHYRGTFIDGTVFDETTPDDPAKFGVGGVIPGWTEALQLMKVGSKYELAIPSDLAYGQGRPGIPPNSVLLFEVELLGIGE